MTDDTSGGGRVFTIPNLISLARLAGVPVFLWLVLAVRSQAGDWWAVGLLVAASASDWLDGKIARALNQQSNLGEVLDPAADRLYIVSTIIALAVRGIIGWWLVAILAARELTLGDRFALPAPGRLRTAESQLRREGGHFEPSLRISAAFSRVTSEFVCECCPGLRLGLRSVGNCTVLVGCRALSRADPPPARC